MAPFITGPDMARGAMRIAALQQYQSPEFVGE